MATTVKVALCQILCGSDKYVNLKTAEQAIDEAAKQGAKIVSLPECFNRFVVIRLRSTRRRAVAVFVKCGVVNANFEYVIHMPPSAARTLQINFQCMLNQSLVPRKS